MEKIMTEGKEWKLILLFTLPLMAGNLLQQLYNTVDGIIVGNFVGEAALSAVGTCAPLTLLFIAIAMGMSTGASIVVSQFYGAGALEEMRRSVATALLMLMGLGVVLSVLAFAGTGWLLKGVLGVQDYLLADAVTYFRIYALGLFFQFVYNIAAAVLRSLGNSRATLYVLLLSSICNVVLDEHKKVVRCVAGDVIEAHREGCKFLDSLYAVRIAQKADCVIVSQGGYPKDLNIYQAQKALDNARHAVKKGGTIIWVSSCKERYGSDVFARWIHDYRTPQQCVEEIEKHFELGGHKAAAIAMAAMDAQLIFVNDLPEEMTRMVYSEPAPSVQAAVDEVLQQNPDATFLLMPYGGSTLPKCEA